VQGRGWVGSKDERLRFNTHTHTHTHIQHTQLDVYLSSAVSPKQLQLFPFRNIVPLLLGPMVGGGGCRGL